MVKKTGTTPQQKSVPKFDAAPTEQIEPGSTLPRFRGKAKKTLRLIDEARATLEAIQPASCRAVAYRLFVMKKIRSMKKAKKVERILKIAREEGTIPWEWITDETRNIERISTWDDPARFAKDVTRSYKKDKWQAQPYRIEVWSEKGTVRGTLKPVLDRFEVPFRVMHGFASATTVHDAAEMVGDEDRILIILYVGDWDPSGLSDVDLPGRLVKYGADPDRFEIRRVALTEADLTDLPSFAAATKQADPRYQWFTSLYGDRCWELDALSPVDLRDRVTTEILSLLDVETWNRYVRAEEVEQESIAKAVAGWKRLAVRS